MSKIHNPLLSLSAYHRGCLWMAKFITKLRIMYESPMELSLGKARHMYYVLRMNLLEWFMTSVQLFNYYLCSLYVHVNTIVFIPVYAFIVLLQLKEEIIEQISEIMRYRISKLKSHLQLHHRLYSTSNT